MYPEYERNNSIVKFYPPEFYPLDNFSSFSINLEDGNLYPTSEHAYQASKFSQTNPQLADLIMKARSAHEAKEIAHVNIENIRPDWEDVKLEVMRIILWCKVQQHPYVLKKLLQTGDRVIIENSPNDLYWGMNSSGEGENNLGKLWMEIREALRKKMCQ